MRRALYILIILLIYPALGSAREAWRGWCEIGGAHVVTSALTSTTTVQKSSTGCLVTVYVTGSTLATIYSDNNGTPLANPFSADTTTGMWKFYAANGRYDVTTTSATLGVVTYSDILICDPADPGSACGTTVGSGVNFYKNGTLIALESGVNFIEGTNVTIDPAVDDPGNNRVALTFNSAEQVALAGTLVGVEPQINFIQGANAALTVVDNTGVSPPRIDVTIAASPTRGLVFTIGDPGASLALTAASTTTEYLTVPFACTISAYNLAIDAGTITVAFWKIATGTAIPTVANIINTSGVSIASGTAIHSTTVTDFTTLAVAANDIIAMNVTAVATAKYVNGVLQCQ